MGNELSDIVSGKFSPTNIARDPKCFNLNGTYSFYGEALPGMPTYFRFRSGKLALDEMLGLDLSVPGKNQLTRVELVHSDTIELIVRGRFGVLSRKHEWVPGDKMSCEEGKITIQRTRKGRGEAVSGTVSIANTLALAKDGALIVTTHISGHSKTLFFNWPNQSEEYGARFVRLGGE